MDAKPRRRFPRAGLFFGRLEGGLLESLPLARPFGDRASQYGFKICPFPLGECSHPRD